MQVLMLVVLFVFSSLCGFLVRGIEAGFSGIFGAHGAEGNQLSEVLLVTRGAFRRGGSREKKILEAVVALFAEIFIDRHESLGSGSRVILT